MSVTIDAQVHAYERDQPARPWVGTLHGPLEVTGDDMVGEMNAVGVDGALLISPYSMYRYDASYALEVFANYPTRFGLIKPFNPGDADVGDQVSRWADIPGVVGARIMLAYESQFSADHGGVKAIMHAGAAAGIPVNILCWGNLDKAQEIARQHPNTQMIIDHLGLKQPFEPPVPTGGFDNLEQVLALAAHDNVAIKITGACTLSTKPFPYADIWSPLEKLFTAFGFERCLWGTDWTRATCLLTYRQAVEAFRVTDSLSVAEREMLMGGALSAIYGWSPG
jgi:L-fuconolactonase